jgi:invasion protein IalB
MALSNEWGVRAGAALGILVVGVLAGWIGRGALAGPDDVATIKVYDSWRLACPAISAKQGSCALGQDIVNSQNGTSIAHLVLLKADGKLTLSITVPHNVLLDPGLGLQFGKERFDAFPYETCEARGCIVLMPADDKLIAKLSSNQDARLVLASIEGKAVALPISLKGFAAAWHAMDSSEAKRQSWWRRLWS